MTVTTTLLIAAAIVLIVSLCLFGTLMSCLALSGTWLIALAAAVTAMLPGDAMPGWSTVVVFLLIAATVEGCEFMAGYWGVRQRKGSPLASFVALVGGGGGMLLGTLIPIPFFGPLIGMIALSFLLVYIVEHRRLRASSAAAHIATGVVVSRIAVILLKVGASLGMSAWLIFQITAALI